AFVIDTQRSNPALPVDLTLEPVRVIGSAGDVGLIALAFGDEAQAERVSVEGLSRVNVVDFDAKLLEGIDLVAIKQVFRYGAEAAKAEVRVTAVEPEVRVEAWEWISLGEDRLVVALDLGVSITRA